MLAEHEAFSRALRVRSDRLEARPEQPEDIRFVHWLAARCSPLKAILPPAMLEQQAAAQEAGHRAQHPRAMRSIVSVAGVLAGRIVIDWSGDRTSHGVDLAVLPEARNSGAGLHMLRAWLEVADEDAWCCTLEVNRDNPAVRLYDWLGFRPGRSDAREPPGPFMRMIRAPRPASAGGAPAAGRLGG